MFAPGTLARRVQPTARDHLARREWRMDDENELRRACVGPERPQETDEVHVDWMARTRGA